MFYDCFVVFLGRLALVFGGCCFGWFVWGYVLYLWLCLALLCVYVYCVGLFVLCDLRCLNCISWNFLGDCGFGFSVSSGLGVWVDLMLV